MYFYNSSPCGGTIINQSINQYMHIAYKSIAYKFQHVSSIRLSKHWPRSCIYRVFAGLSQFLQAGQLETVGQKPWN